MAFYETNEAGSSGPFHLDCSVIYIEMKRLDLDYGAYQTFCSSKCDYSKYLVRIEGGTNSLKLEVSHASSGHVLFYRPACSEDKHAITVFQKGSDLPLLES